MSRLPSLLALLPIARTSESKEADYARCLLVGVASALEDSRFNPIKKSELPTLGCGYVSQPLPPSQRRTKLRAMC